jgi:predicted ABC-type ATPase
MVAGPNGSGKSTLVAALRADTHFELPELYINADDLQRTQHLDDTAAQWCATELRAHALAHGTDVMFETVMSHPSKIAELQRAKAAGYHITVHLVATDHPDINVQRVQARVGAGGHHVPVERIHARYHRTLALAPLALVYADQAVLFDNTHSGSTGHGLSLQAHLHAGRAVYAVEKPANWVKTVVTQFNERLAEFESLVDTAKTQDWPLELAPLHNESTHGVVVALGRYLVVQYNKPLALVHERMLLGDWAHTLAVGDTKRIAYREGQVQPELGEVSRH